MAAQQPADVHRLIAEALSTGDRAAALALYEADATMVPEPGQVVSGIAGIEGAIDAFLALKPVLDVRDTQVTQAEEIALLRSNWTLTGTGDDGQPLEMSGASTDVVRRQADGSWRYVIDNPYGGS
ncbi:MAG: YybH family protein [Dehalococcoidia bacterium]